MIDVLVSWPISTRLVIGAAFCILAVSAEAPAVSIRDELLTLSHATARDPGVPYVSFFVRQHGSVVRRVTAPDGAPITDYSDRVDAWINSCAPLLKSSALTPEWPTIPECRVARGSSTVIA